MKFLILFLHTAGVISASDRLSLIPDMSTYCPYSRTCRRSNDTTKEISELQPGMRSCCTDCSCDDDCVDNCCFPNPENKDHNYQECFYLSTKQPPRSKRHLYSSYHVVTKSPKPGCPCSNVELPKKRESNPWENLSPVSSAVSGRIYKDISLAKCFCENDVVPWPSVIACDKFSPGEFVNYDILTDPEIMNSRNKICRVHFYYPGNEADIRSEQCYHDVIDTCDELFSVPFGLGMSKDDITAACTSGFVAPFTYSGQYANVFCHICNGQYFRMPVRSCKGIYQLKYGVTAMIGFLKSSFHTSNIGSPRRKNKREACPTQTSNSMGCREILCPEGRLQMDNGACVVAFTAFGKRGYQINLSLTPVEPLAVSDIENYREHGVNTVIPEWNRSPWPDVWHINVMSYVVGLGPDPLVELVTIEQYIEAFNTTFESIIYDVGRVITQRWEMNIGNATINFQQSFCPREFKFTNRHYFEIFTDQNHNKTEKRELRTLYSKDTRPPPFPVYITKRFICKQIKLEADEYTLIDERLILNRTGRILFDLEFSKPPKLGGNSVVRICLDDSGLVEMYSGSPSLRGYAILIHILVMQYLYIQ